MITFVPHLPCINGHVKSKGNLYGASRLHLSLILGQGIRLGLACTKGVECNPMAPSMLEEPFA